MLQLTRTIKKKNVTYKPEMFGWSTRIYKVKPGESNWILHTYS